MKNSFFENTCDEGYISRRVRELESAKVGFYSVGLYPASLAYNCAMQTEGSHLILAPRPGRDLFGAFSVETIEGMDPSHLECMIRMGTHTEGNEIKANNLADLILRCELVILSSNSNHIEEDLELACKLRAELNRKQVVLACLTGSFTYDSNDNQAYVLCEKEVQLGFFSGFHRHGALRNPLDSFTANFCHPDSLTAFFGARILDKLSPNIQVSSGIHNVEGQYIKAAKNMSSILAGFGYSIHASNPGLLPTFLTLLLNQCLDQAASVSMCRNDRDLIYSHQPLPLTELGYGVQKIEAALLVDGDMQNVRDHTFAQLTAMVADVRGSMMQPVSGVPTRNFQVGQILGELISREGRCPNDIHELISECEKSGLKKGGLEGLNSLKYWPQIIHRYSIPLNDSSMINLLYICIYGSKEDKEVIFNVMTQSRLLSNFCQESVRPKHSRMYANLLDNIELPGSIEMIVDSIKMSNVTKIKENSNLQISKNVNQELHIKAISIIENFFREKRI